MHTLMIVPFGGWGLSAIEVTNSVRGESVAFPVSKGHMSSESIGGIPGASSAAATPARPANVAYLHGNRAQTVRFDNDPLTHWALFPCCQCAEKGSSEKAVASERCRTHQSQTWMYPCWTVPRTEGGKMPPATKAAVRTPPSKSFPFPPRRG